MCKLFPLIVDFQNGHTEVFIQIMEQMAPVINKYSRRLYSYEYEDAHQELLISLFRAVQVIPQFNTDAQCVKYLAATIYHRFCTLYRQTWHLPDRKETPVENPEFYMPYTFSSYVNDYSIFNLDIRQFIQNLKNEKHRQILIFFLYGQLNDREIADLLHTPRQYIYRTRKSLLQKLYHDLYKLN